jgi:cytochrome c peroxidase
MSKLFLQYLVVGCFLFLLLGTVHRREPSVGLEPALAYFKKASNDFAVSTAELQAAIRLIDARDRKTVDLAKAALRNSRIHYKRIEYFLAYFFPYAAGAYNAPAKPEIEEPTLEYQEPTGLQYIEALLFEENVAARKATLLQQADLIYSSAADLNALLYNFQGDDKQLLESLRIELVRIITLTIAGFDAPLLKSGLAEAREALAVMDITLQPFLNKPGKTADSIDYYLKGARNYLKENQDFDSFDRLSFLSRQALPLQHQLNKFINEQGLELNTIPVLNGNARNIFSPEAMHLSAFTTEKNMAAGPVIQLGKILFSENALSGNNSRSCATCHQPEKYFTDGLAKSIAFSGHSIVKRNAPTLLYAGFQQTQFWDGRVKSLTDQIKMVLTSPVEMNANQQEIIKRLLQQPAYQKMFAEAFPQQKDSLITMNTIANALAAYIFTLKPFNSPFDKYLQGNKKAMSAEQIK